MSRFALRSTLCLLFIVLIASAAYTLLQPSEPKLIHSQDSNFGALLVFEEGDERCMNFETMYDHGRQTCISLRDPKQLVFAYTRMMVSALYLNPQPKNILIIGLGGASLANALANILPNTTIDSVEIEPAVAQVAQQYFNYQLGPRQRLYIEDGRAYVEQANTQGLQYDMVMLDAFDMDYIPEHLMTLEFLQQLKRILSPQGILIANTFTESDLYDQESATYAHVFGDFFNLEYENRVIITSNGPLPSLSSLRRNADLLEAEFNPIGIDKNESLALFKPSVVKQGIPLLRDSHSTLGSP